MAVFNASTEAPVVLKAGKAVVSVGESGEPMIALGVTVQYSRQVEAVPVLGKNRVISIGEPQGTIQFESVVSKKVNLTSAFKLGEDGCDPFEINLSFSDGGCDESGRSIKCLNCVASAVSITAQGGRGYIGQGIQVTFLGLDITG